MKFRDYLSSKIITLCFLGIGALCLSVFLSVYGVGIGVILTAAGLAVLICAGWLACGYLLASRRLARIHKISDELSEKYLLGEVMPKPSGALEAEYFEIMREVSRSAIGEADRARREVEDYRDYVESWIHELKTPLTACSLILDNDGDRLKLRRELKRADNLCESILYYARMRTVEKDVKITELRVSDAIGEALRSQMELLIAAGIGVDTDGDFSVCSDKKQLVFILKQLLINSAKYCPGCHITIQADAGIITYEDNGIGIPAHELPRVTERGFTGTNTGKTGGTGMGLYIASELCGQLGITLRIESEVGKYTRFTLGFDSLTKT